MLSFSKLLSKFYYWFDSIKLSKLYVRIEHFSFDNSLRRIIVVYRLGKKNLLHRQDISEFEKNFIGNIPAFDRYRLIKFSLLQNMLEQLFKQGRCSKEEFIGYVEGEIKNAKLF